MKKILTALIVSSLSGMALANSCDSTGFDSASRGNERLRGDIKALSEQYVEACSWDYDMPREKVCSLFTGKLKQLNTINDAPLARVLSQAEMATDAWYAVHENCADKGLKGNADSAFEAYEESFDAYNNLIKEIDTRYNQSCRQQIEENISKYCK
ncbi:MULTISPECIES: hypothetical protein [unclassified Agarivorans]|uniref:hypothetical protein n=1 Tax=unclassified Agarivorans TaxID=2636026 RepID=UPI0026E178D0|nr:MULTISPECIES: hypothetical protein [unclassified Agarivorans]MDO6684326.1 hypothetical protein [Agarivorans sp. 3_MG-2023]MDO6714491.1 hypothetical protein [Agarivorans sp. 2_MG-2023]